MTNITDTVSNLISLPHEYEWLDFKSHWEIVNGDKNA